jgi:hypothetical protein
MSDAAFKTAAFPGYTTHELIYSAPSRPYDIRHQMEAEIERRMRVKAGDVSVMTPAERLRHSKAKA